MSKPSYYNNWQIYYLKYGPLLYFGQYTSKNEVVLRQYGGVEYGI